MENSDQLKDKTAITSWTTTARVYDSHHKLDNDISIGRDK